MSNINNIANKIENIKDKNLFLDIHKKIMSVGNSVDYLVFPIYIRYTKGDNILAILYYNKKDLLDLGLNIYKDLINSKFKDAKYMKYPGINYSIKIKKEEDLSDNIIDYLKKL